MKIGVDGRLIDKFRNTGISRYTFFLIDYYIHKYGEENIYIITNDLTLQIFKCKMIYTDLLPYNLFHFMLYWKFIEKKDFNVLHIPYYSGTFLKLKKTKVIVTVHDLMYYHVKDFFGKNFVLNCLKKQYFNFIVRRSISNSDKIISVSKITQKDLYEIFNVSSITIPEVSHLEVNSDKRIINKLGLINIDYFFYCGNSRPHKNLDLLRRVFEKESNLPPLVMAGPGHKSSNHIIAAGIVSEEELKALYESSVALIFPSKYEGFGLPVLEALFLGKPVVASNIPAFMEFHSENIIYFSVDSETELLKALRKVLLHQFKEEPFLLKKYTKEYIYTMLDDLILSII